MKKCLAVFTVVLFLMVLFVPCSSAQQKFDLKMMTGPMGGSWYPLGGAIGDAIQKEIPGVTMAVSPGGGVGNVEAIEFGKCDIGFSNSSSGVDGVLRPGAVQAENDPDEAVGQSLSPIFPDRGPGRFGD